MRHEDCLTCRFAAGGDLTPVVLNAVTEMLDPGTHHHHLVRCEDCRAFWFDDIVTGGLGIPVPSRRDTVLCDCPEDGTGRFTRSVVSAPMAEAECRCTAALIYKNAMSVRLGSQR